MRLRTEHFVDHIQDQNEFSLTVHVFRLKKEKALLKRKIETHQIGEPQPLPKNDALKILRYRWYIKDILSAFDKIGKSCVCNAREKEAIQFQKNIPFIARVEFYIGGYLGGLERYQVIIEEDRAHLTYALSDTESIPPMILMEPEYLSKEQFSTFLRSLHMGEWQDEYTTNRFHSLELRNTVWEVDVYYNNGLAVKSFSGLNVFPYNFSSFQRFFESRKKKIDQI